MKAKVATHGAVYSHSHSRLDPEIFKLSQPFVVRPPAVLVA
jgi:hypothetical protein